MSGEFCGAGSAAAPESALAGEPGAGGAVATLLKTSEVAKAVCSALNALIKTQREDLFYYQESTPLVVKMNRPFSTYGEGRFKKFLEESAINFLKPIFSLKQSMHRQNHGEFDCHNFGAGGVLSASEAITKLNALVAAGQVLIELLPPRNFTDESADFAFRAMC